MYPYFKTASNAWHSSVRHNLYADGGFITRGRSSLWPYKAYWYIHPSNIERFKRGDFTPSSKIENSSVGNKRDKHKSPYTQLIAKVMLASGKTKLTLNEIYEQVRLRT